MFDNLQQAWRLPLDSISISAPSTCPVANITTTLRGYCLSSSSSIINLPTGGFSTAWRGFLACSFALSCTSLPVSDLHGYFPVYVPVPAWRPPLFEFFLMHPSCVTHIAFSSHQPFFSHSVLPLLNCHLRPLFRFWPSFPPLLHAGLHKHWRKPAHHAVPYLFSYIVRLLYPPLVLHGVVYGEEARGASEVVTAVGGGREGGERKSGGREGWRETRMEQWEWGGRERGGGGGRGIMGKGRKSGRKSGEGIEGWSGEVREG